MQCVDRDQRVTATPNRQPKSGTHVDYYYYYYYYYPTVHLSRGCIFWHQSTGASALRLGS